MSDSPGARISRRHALGGMAGVGLGVPLLAACGGDDSTASDPAPTGRAGEVLTTTAEVPVGSGVILTDAEVVVTQPTEGEFKAYSNICTHQGCPLETITADGARCPCHGSVFDLATGEPTEGPATSSLTELPLSVEGDQIALA